MEIQFLFTKKIKNNKTNKTPRYLLDEIIFRKKDKTNKEPRNLPDEIIEDILSRLPVDSLLRFKSVCKSWLALINSSNFINDHLHQSEKSNNVNLVIRQGTRFYYFDYPPTSIDLEICHSECTRLHRVPPFCLVGSCNGLLCLKRFGEDIFVIINPSTKRVKEVKCRSSSIFRMNKLPKIFGFGYDDLTKDYKIVALVGDMHQRRTDVFIYSFNKTCWRKVIPSGLSLEIKVGNKSNGGVFIGVSLHWATDKNLVFSINCINEESGLLPLSESMDRDTDMYLTKLSGKLCAIYYYENSFNMWVMENYGVKESWRKVYDVENNGVFRLYVESRRLQFVQGAKSIDGAIPYILMMEEENVRSLVSKLHGLHVCVDSLINVDTIIKKAYKF